MAEQGSETVPLPNNNTNNQGVGCGSAAAGCRPAANKSYIQIWKETNLEKY